jgi:hypothetical protein
MSWAHVQSATASASGAVSTLSVTPGSPVTAGNLVVVGVANYNASIPAFTCKDVVNNTNYTLVSSIYSVSAYQVAVFWYIVPTGGSSFTVTVTFTGTNYPSMTFDEYSFPTGATVSVDSSGTAAAASSLAGNLTVTGTDLIYATCTVSTGSVSIGSGFTQRTKTADLAGQHMGITTEDQLDVSGNMNPSFATAPYIMYGVAFKFVIAYYTFNATALAISGASGTSTAGPSPGMAGLAISGGYGGVTFPVSSPATGLAISGASGTSTAGPSLGAAGLAISGGIGGTAETVTVLLAGLGLSGAPGGATGAGYLGPFYLPYEYTSVVIETGNSNPFGIDPEATTVITTGLTGSD